MKKNRKQNNVRNVFMIFTVALLGIFAIIFALSDKYKLYLAQAGTDRLVTKNWELAEQKFQNIKPNTERKYAYYQIKENENLQKISNRFSIPVEKLKELNTDEFIPGVTIKVPPLEAPMSPAQPTNNYNGLLVNEEKGFLQVKNDYKNDTVVFTLPTLMEFLKPYNAISQPSNREFLVNRPILLHENIRIDITSETTDTLKLKSNPNQDIVCLCIKNSSMLIDSVNITTFDSAIGEPDKNYKDYRSFIRAVGSSRLDILNSRVSYLGMPLEKIKTNPILNEGGTYGMSWRIPDDKLGQDIVTGWVENTTFDYNHFGAYTFGASGMMWRGNVFEHNDVYGLDPHDDSNNALVEDNVFRFNGKHGFIVSKRCNYNIVRNNISHDNGLHGFMFHQDSVFNTFENNLAYNNTDNFVIYASNYNQIVKNRSFNAKNNHIRINAGSVNNFVTDNIFAGGKSGVYAYGNVKNIYVSGNKFYGLEYNLKTSEADMILFANNKVDELNYKLNENDRVVFGPNTIERQAPEVPSEVGGLDTN